MKKYTLMELEAKKGPRIIWTASNRPTNPLARVYLNGANQLFVEGPTVIKVCVGYLKD